MAENTAPALPDEEDYRRYDRIWRRVSPEMNPYPEVRSAQKTGPDAVKSEWYALRGQEPDACCMGSTAQGELEMIQGFIREEIADAHIYRALSRRTAATEARRVFRRLAEEEGRHARCLRSVNYLISGSCYQVTVCFTPAHMRDYCALLRERYHEEACDGANYARAAERTADVCLRRLFEELSADEFRHAERLRCLLERVIG